MSYEDYRAAEIAKHSEMLDHWLKDDLQHDGENRLGIEFKHDQQFRHTGNLYIETAEKARPRDGDYARAGVYRRDNTRLWVQGDHDEVWIFPKTVLIAAHQSKRYREIVKDTSLGFLLPCQTADDMALWKVLEGRAPRPIPGPYRFRCICREPDLGLDGRCRRCWGNPDQDESLVWVGWNNPDPLSTGQPGAGSSRS